MLWVTELFLYVNNFDMSGSIGCLGNNQIDC